MKKLFDIRGEKYLSLTWLVDVLKPFIIEMDQKNYNDTLDRSEIRFVTIANLHEFVNTLET